MEFSDMIIKYPDDLKVTLYSQNKPEENFPIGRRGRYSLKYQGKSYSIRNDVIDYSDYLFTYFETKSEECELVLEFKFATSIKAYHIVMKLLFGFKDVHIPNNEYVQILAFLEELSNRLFTTLFILL